MLLLSMLLLTAISGACAAFDPRVSGCDTPEAMTGAPGKLPKTPIPSAYTKGGLLAVNKKWTAYAGTSDDSELTIERTGRADDMFTDWVSDHLSAIILDGDAVICLVGGWFSDTSAIEVYQDEEIIFSYQFDVPTGAEDISPQGGQMLLLPDGTLLVLDMFGVLYACKTDDYDFQKVTDTTMSEIVYYDGMIYFANLDDVAEYRDVYSETDDEYQDLYYPKLYRMNLDGSGIEKLTDCGVWGLASQGNIILYQNIDEAFVFNIFELSGPNFLSGPLYRYDAKTGEHRPLGIESNQYIPTPYGLAVWYNEFRIEPYDVERADLVLHDYDGNPLYKLDAGVIELFGGYTVADTNIEFHSYNWYPMILWNMGIEESWDDDDGSEDVFTTVPLDGSKKIGGVKEIPQRSEYTDDDVDYIEDDWYDDEWYGDDEWYDGDDWWFDDDEGYDSGWGYIYPGMFDDGWAYTDATLNQRMATRTGPGTKYAEDHGTLPESTEIVIYAQEDSGGTPWVLVEFVKDGKLIRAYTGMKRVDADTASIRKTTKNPKAATVTRSETAYYGPGTAYLAFASPIGVGTEVLVYGVDREYALIEFALGADIWTRCWVPESCIAFK